MLCADRSPVPSLPPATDNAIMPALSVKHRIAFYHATLFSPVMSTWINAININAGHFPTWPDLTAAQVRRHFPISVPMLQGHMDQARANQQSTKVPAPALAPAPVPNTSADPEPIPARTNAIYIDLQHVTGQVFSDQTGRFPTVSSSGNNYIMIVYDYDSNFVHAELLKSRTGPCIVAAYQRAHHLLSSRGLTPQLQRLDNEASHALLQFLQDKHIDVQLSPPHVHRRNAAERAIRTFKNHFIAGLCSTHPDFPVHLWDRLLPQAIQTLNMLRSSRLHPHICAYTHVHGVFDYNRTPLAPPGIKVMIHVKPAARGTWAPHAVPGWYLGPAMLHYRCYRVWATQTRAERVSDTLAWLPHAGPMPVISSLDRLHSAAADLTEALLQRNTIDAMTILPDATREAIITLSAIFSDYLRPIQDTAAPAARQLLPPPPKVPPAPPRVAVAAPATWAAIAAQPAIAALAPLHRTRSTTTGRIATFDPRTHQRIVPTMHAANLVNDPITGAGMNYHQLLNSPDASQWSQVASNEIGRLAQGVLPHMPSGTDTIHFIHHTELPAGRKPTYLRVVAEYQPHKEEKHRIRFTCGGDKIVFPGNVSTETADLTTAKLLFNSVLSTPYAKFAAFDIKNFYLNNPMERFEYMWIPARDIPADIMQQYQLASMIHNERVLVEIRKGMYGLPQAGIIANTRLQAHLATHGYLPCAHTLGLFRHTDRPVTFSLVVDDFGVKYVGQDNADHLLHCLQELYTVTTDWTGTKYCGLTLAWNYQARTVQLSMPGYIAKALHRFQHPQPGRPQHSPHQWSSPQYGTAHQMTADIDASPKLDPPAVLRLQEVLGTLLYYARAIDSTMLVALGSLAAADTTHTTAQGITQLLNYAATYPDGILEDHASDMILHGHSGASYLSKSNARSRIGGFFFLSSAAAAYTTNIDANAPPPPENGAVHVPCAILKVVVYSAAEAELGALFHNGKEAVSLTERI